MAKEKKSKKQVNAVNQLAAHQATKEHFIELCKQHKQLSMMFSNMTQVLNHPQFVGLLGRTILPVEYKKALQQHVEMGKEMTSIGALLDLQGGKKVMKKDDDKKKEDNDNDKEDQFVSNTKPPVNNTKPKDDKDGDKV